MIVKLKFHSTFFYFIFSIISEKSLRARLIANGLAHVKRFSWDRMARQTLQVYNKALK